MINKELIKKLEEKKLFEEKLRYQKDLLENYFAIEDMISNSKHFSDLLEGFIAFDNAINRFGLKKLFEQTTESARGLLEDAIKLNDKELIKESLYALCEVYFDIHQQIKSKKIGNALKPIQQKYLIESFDIRKPIILSEAVMSIEQVKPLMDGINNLKNIYGKYQSKLPYINKIINNYSTALQTYFTKSKQLGDNRKLKADIAKVEMLYGTLTDFLKTDIAFILGQFDQIKNLSDEQKKAPLRDTLSSENTESFNLINNAILNRLNQSPGVFQKLKNVFKLNIDKIINIKTFSTEFLGLSVKEMEQLAGLGKSMQIINPPDPNVIAPDQPNQQTTGAAQTKGNPTTTQELQQLIQSSKNDTTELIKGFITKNGIPLMNDTETLKTLFSDPTIKKQIEGFLTTAAQENTGAQPKV